MLGTCLLGKYYGFPPATTLGSFATSAGNSKPTTEKTIKIIPNKTNTLYYFVSFATVYWIDIFTRQAYFNVLANSVNYCRSEKGMQLYAYCFMSSHVHMVFSSTNEQPMDLLRDVKKYTSKKIIEAITNNQQESRQEWLLWMLERAGKKSGNVTQYQLWQHHNQPIELWSDKVIKQKIEYIHNNPVISGLVTEPIHYKYSSARNYQDDNSVLEIDDPGFMG